MITGSDIYFFITEFHSKYCYQCIYVYFTVHYIDFYVLLVVTATGVLESRFQLDHCVATGCYQRTPLYIVLCGRAETFLSSPRNFFLTKLLIERGGDVNLRIPEVRSHLLTFRDHLHIFVGQSSPSFSSTFCFQSCLLSLIFMYPYLPRCCRYISV